MKYNFILASQSPRRQELIGHLHIPFKIISPDIDENSSQLNPSLMVRQLAQQKANKVWEDLSLESKFGKSFFPCILAADTTVALKGKILGKPSDQKEAAQILSFLSGQTHSVFTGVCLKILDIKSKKMKETTFVDETLVTFENIPEDVLSYYVKSGGPMDKAGAYGIQGEALTFISNVQGSYSNVVGLPLSYVLKELRNILDLNQDQLGQWRDLFQ